MRQRRRFFYENSSQQIIHGDAMAILPTLEPDSFDMVVADPPYSSGGQTAGERRMSVESKYSQDGNACGRPTFGGDAKDQRSFTWWSMAWMSLCRPLLRKGGYCLVFTDWRQLPAVTDAMQAADLTWRGVIAWDKGLGSRAPHTGYARHQCEFIVWGTRGPCPKSKHGGPWPGAFTCHVTQRDKHHQTGKPTDVLRQLVRMAPPGGRILDPFAGSFTSLVAADLEGRRGVGIEIEEPYCVTGRSRLSRSRDQAAA